MTRHQFGGSGYRSSSSASQLGSRGFSLFLVMTCQEREVFIS
jgi:hypothetical protein